MNKLNRWKEEYQSVQPPQELQELVNAAIDRAVREKKKQQARKRKWLSWAAVLVVMIGLPNISADAARVMGELPFIGGLFRVVTVRNYQYDDGHSTADAAIPMVVEEAATAQDAKAGAVEEAAEEAAEDPQAEVAVVTAMGLTGAETETYSIEGRSTKDKSDTVGAMEGRMYNSGESTTSVVPPLVSGDSQGGTAQLNEQVEEYITRLLEEFETNMDTIGEGYQGLNIDYEVKTDTDSWFTLQINAEQTMASGAQQVRYYHIDKTTGEIAILADLFKEDADYVTILSDEIRRQMAEQMEADINTVYFYQDEMFPEDNFNQISPEQNFYFNEKEELVIVFDEYEVAPGSMGCPQFIIPESVLEGIRR